VRAVDLDLDVLRGWSGRVWVDDEDEFAEHRKRFGYPDDVAALAVASCDQVRGAVAAGRPPFDGTAARWMRQLEEVTGLR
jgi:protein associated with RNAse G/E